MKTKARFFIASSIALTLSFLFAGILIYNYQFKQLKAASNERMEQHLNDVNSIFEIELFEKKAQLNAAIKVANHLFFNKNNIGLSSEPQVLNATNQFTGEVSSITFNPLTLDGQSLFKSYSIVDSIKSFCGTTSTIFQLTEVGFVRISTNVLNSKGERAVSTFLPLESPVAKAVLETKSFAGRARVVDNWYQTMYKAITNDGKIVGMLYVGIPENDLEYLKRKLYASHFYNDGFAFTIQLDKEPYFLLHPKLEGKPMVDKDLMDKMKSSTSGLIRHFDKETEKWLFDYYLYNSDLQVYNVIRVSENEMLNKPMQSMFYRILIGMLLGLVVSLVATNYLIDNVIIPLKKSIAIIDEVSKGDLTIEVKHDRKDEMGQLQLILNKMTTDLNSIIGKTKATSNELQIASDTFKHKSEKLSEGAMQQSASAEEVASSMEQMAANIEQNTTNSRETEVMAHNTFVEVQEVAKSTNEAVEAMNDIASRIRIISDIAFQTNLLALNAAVEAARAGENGRGFAVVAAEVRRLAEHSKQAAIEIEASSQRGVTVIQRAGLKLNELVPQIEKTSSLIQEITISSLEQNSGAENINIAIQQLNLVVQENLSAAEDLARNAEFLADKASDLKRIIGYFKI